MGLAWIESWNKSQFSQAKLNSENFCIVLGMRYRMYDRQQSRNRKVNQRHKVQDFEASSRKETFNRKTESVASYSFNMFEMSSIPACLSEVDAY